MIWGYHLIINCTRCEKDSVSSEQNIKSFVESLVNKIDMIPHGDIHTYYMDDQGDNSGWSFVQMIKTSNICGHFVDDSGDAFLDVFSCKKFNEKDVLDMINEYFKPEKIHHEFFTRST